MRTEVLARLREVLRKATWSAEYVRVRQDDLRALVQEAMKRKKANDDLASQIAEGLNTQTRNPTEDRE